MFEVIFLIVLAVVWIGAATICDLKSREVPNWINFSLIIFALGFRFFYSLFSQNAQGFSFFTKD
jgi:Flp pilus assembly protein protease CpaA